MKHEENVHASRRGFLKKSAALLGTFPLAANTAVSPYHSDKINKVVPKGVKLSWLTKPLRSYHNATCGIVWPRGEVNRKYSFEAADEAGNPVPLQSWPLAYWPDGSIKWTAHSVVSVD